MRSPTLLTPGVCDDRRCWPCDQPCDCSQLYQQLVGKTLTIGGLPSSPLDLSSLNGAYLSGPADGRCDTTFGGNLFPDNSAGPILDTTVDDQGELWEWRYAPSISTPNGCGDSYGFAWTWGLEALCPTEFVASVLIRYSLVGFAPNTGGQRVECVGKQGELRSPTGSGLVGAITLTDITAPGQPPLPSPIPLLDSWTAEVT